MLVRDIMSRSVFTVWPTDPVEGAAALLAGREIAAVPVVDERNRLVGMVSEVDLLRGRVPAEPALSPRLTTDVAFRRAHRPHIVAEVMTRAVVIAEPLQDVAEVMRTMLERNVRSVPVLDEGHLVGIVSRRDVLRTVVQPRRNDAVFSGRQAVDAVVRFGQPDARADLGRREGRRRGDGREGTAADGGRCGR